MATDQFRSWSLVSDVYDGAEPQFSVPPPPARLCTRCMHALAQLNPEDICFCCQRKEAMLQAQRDGLRESNNGNRKPVRSERNLTWNDLTARERKSA